MGAPLAGKFNSVLLLADEKDGKGNPIAVPAVNYLAKHSSEIYAGYILGGESAVSKTLVNRILAATDGMMASSLPTEPALPSSPMEQETSGSASILTASIAQLDGFGGQQQTQQLTAAPLG